LSSLLAVGRVPIEAKETELWLLFLLLLPLLRVVATLLR
jgi:hypothetical protein